MQTQPIDNLPAGDAVSLLRSEAARRNGAKSRGPKTDAGKQRSAQNALKHGMHSRSIVLAGESEAAYQQLRDEYLAENQPQGPAERHLVETLLDAEWRIRSFREIETVAAAQGLRNQKGTATLKIAHSYSHDINWDGPIGKVYTFEPKLQRDWDRALRRLRELRKARTQPQPGPRPVARPSQAPAQNHENEPEPQLAPAPPPVAATPVNSMASPERTAATPALAAQLPAACLAGNAPEGKARAQVTGAERSAQPVCEPPPLDGYRVAVLGEARESLSGPSSEKSLGRNPASRICPGRG